MQTKNLISLQVVLNFITCIESVFLICFRLKVHSPTGKRVREQASERAAGNRCKSRKKFFFQAIYEFIPYGNATLNVQRSCSFEFNVRQLREL